jgi:hypothetical protein
LDLVGTVAAAFFGWASLFYPFGRDQGLYHYVAREWVLRAQVPYRDVLDHKTPGIYLLHALSIQLLGANMWGIRVFDLLCVLVGGWFAGSLVRPRGQAVPDGLRGLTAVFASMFYFGFLDYWNTAQSELWYSTCGVGAVWAAYRINKEHRAALVAGLFGGLALLMKPPAIWFALVAAVILLERFRARSERSPLAFARVVGFHAVGGLMLPALVLGYFGIKGALPAMKDIVVGANSYYVKHEGGGFGGLTPMQIIFATLRVFEPFSVFLPLGVGLGVLRGADAKDRATFERNFLSMCLMGAAFAGVAMQGKYYLLHWGVTLVPAALMATNVALNVAALLSRPFVARCAVAALFLVGYTSTAWMGGGAEMWLDATRATVAHLRGHLSKEDFFAHFKSPGAGYWFDHSYRVGRWLKEHTSAGDNVTVRGFQPEIYAVAERHHVGRFFWTTFLTNPARAYRREEWLAEDERALREHPPKFVVTLTDIPEGPDSPAWFRARGYETVETMGEFTIMRPR